VERQTLFGDARSSDIPISFGHGVSFIPYARAKSMGILKVRIIDPTGAGFGARISMNRSITLALLPLSLPPTIWVTKKVRSRLQDARLRRR